MAKLIVDFYVAKTSMLCFALQNRERRVKIKDTPKPRIKLLDKPKPKVNPYEVAEALGANMVIPLDWVYSFKTDEDILTIMFEEGVDFQAEGEKLFFVKGEEKGFASTKDVRRVYKFGDAVQSLEVLWEKS